MKLKKILIVIDETNFYHPAFFFDLYKKLKSSNYEIFVGLVTEVSKKNSIEKYLFRNIKKLYFIEILKLGLKKIFFICTEKIFRNFKIFFSVKSVIKKFDIKYFEIKNDINKEEYINKIIDIKPDLIISSCSLIFKNRILDIPFYGCINRHSSLLPSFGGVYPVFHSIAKGNNICGVTVHCMTSKIDDGKILSQEKILITDKNLSKIYKECFSKSANLVIEGVNNLINNKFLIIEQEKSYFSFPNNNDWKEFRKNNGRFI